MAEALKAAHAKWPQGIFLAWYPVKERPAIEKFHEVLTVSGIPKILTAEFIYQEEIQADRLNGSGLVLINPPWRMEERLRQFFPSLRRILDTSYAGDQFRWLSPSGL